LYSHFPSKTELLRACLQPLVQEADALLAAAPPVPVTDEQVLGWLTAYIKNNAEYRDAATILLTDQAARAELSDQVVQQSRRLSAMLELFGSTDRVTTVSILGAICLPVVRGELEPSGAHRLAAVLMPVLRPATGTRQRGVGRSKAARRAVTQVKGGYPVGGDVLGPHPQVR
jgi:AcrR family transcriptional regulator